MRSPALRNGMATGPAVGPVPGAALLEDTGKIFSRFRWHRHRSVGGAEGLIPLNDRIA
jgi:hypothetical protein